MKELEKFITRRAITWSLGRYYNWKWDSREAFGSSTIKFPIKKYIIDVGNLSSFFFLALPPFPQQRASIDTNSRKGGRQHLFGHVLELGADLDHQFLKRSELLKPFLVKRFHIWKSMDFKKSQTRRHQPWLGKIHHIFRFATDSQICNRREFLQTPLHPTGKEFLTIHDDKQFQMGRKAPFR